MKFWKLVLVATALILPFNVNAATTHEAWYADSSGYNQLWQSGWSILEFSGGGYWGVRDDGNLYSSSDGYTSNLSSDISGNITWVTTIDQNRAYVNAESTVVPVPAAAWLFGSGLIGLVGMARRKKTA